MSKYVIYLNSASYQFYIDYNNDAKHFLVNGSFGFLGDNQCNTVPSKVFSTAEEILAFIKKMNYISTWYIFTIAVLEPGYAPTESKWTWSQVFRSMDEVVGNEGKDFVNTINGLYLPQ